VQYTSSPSIYLGASAAIETLVYSTVDLRQSLIVHLDSGVTDTGALVICTSHSWVSNKKSINQVNQYQLRSIIINLLLLVNLSCKLKCRAF
jgi:hypothetical protein